MKCCTPYGNRPTLSRSTLQTIDGTAHVKMLYELHNAKQYFFFFFCCSNASLAIPLSRSTPNWAKPFLCRERGLWVERMAMGAWNYQTATGSLTDQGSSHPPPPFLPTKNQTRWNERKINLSTYPSASSGSIFWLEATEPPPLVILTTDSVSVARREVKFGGSR